MKQKIMQERVEVSDHTCEGFFRRDDLGLVFFQAGFKNTCRAASLLSAIGFLLGTGPIYAHNYHDRLELYFSYLNTPSWDTGKQCANEDTTILLRCLIERLKRLNTAFKLEVLDNKYFSNNKVRLTIVKTPVLVVLDEGEIDEVRRNVRWIQMLEDVYGQDWFKQPDSPSIEYLFDLAFTNMVDTYAVHTQRLKMSDFWRYYFAEIELSSEKLSEGGACLKLIDEFDRSTYNNYRFVIIYHYTGQTKITALRQFDVDCNHK